MNASGRSRLPRPWAMVGIGILTIVLALAAAIWSLGFLGEGGCWEGGPGMGPGIWPHVFVIGPPVVTFFVLAYFTLGFRSRLGRVIAGVATLALTTVVALVTQALPHCGF